MAEVSPRQARAAQTTPAKGSPREYGVTGTEYSGGYVWNTDADNKALQGEEWVETATNMMTDPVVSSIWRALSGTLKSATFAFEGGSETAREFLNEAFGFKGHVARMERSFESQLDYLLRYVLLGWRYVEDVYKVEDGLNWLRYFGDRDPSAHNDWLYTANGTLAGVEQFVPTSGFDGSSSAFSMWGNAGEVVTIPANKLLLFTHDRSAANFEGFGLLRPMYYAWKVKQHTFNMLAIGIERAAVGTPTCEVDYSVLAEQDAATGTNTQYSDNAIVEMVDKVKTSLKQYVAHEKAYIVHPKGFTLDEFGSGLFDIGNTKDTIDLCDRQMFYAAMLQFLTLGVNDTGSRSVGETQESFYRRAVVNILDYVVSVIGGPAGAGSGTAGRLLHFNFPTLPVRDYPQMVHDGLDVRIGLDSLAELATGVKAGLITPTNDIEDTIRATGNLDELPEDLQRSPRERLAGAEGGIAAMMQDNANT